MHHFSLNCRQSDWKFDYLATLGLIDRRLVIFYEIFISENSRVYKLIRRFSQKQKKQKKIDWRLTRRFQYLFLHLMMNEYKEFDCIIQNYKHFCLYKEFLYRHVMWQTVVSAYKMRQFWILIKIYILNKLNVFQSITKQK